jgi:general L-amino acid transport system substrate-binding protein
VDLCRAIAAAVIGDREAVQFAPYSATERFAALRAGEIDVLVREASVTLSRDVDLGLEFTGVYYYDGQGIMAPRALNIRSARNSRARGSA